MGQSSGDRRAGQSGPGASRPSRPTPTRWPSCATGPDCRGRPRTGWRSAWRCTACSRATRDGRWRPGPRAGRAGRRRPAIRWWPRPRACCRRLRDTTGESVQVYRRDGLSRVCVAAAEPASGLRDTVPLGARLPMTAGSGAKVLTAWAEPSDPARGAGGRAFTERTLAEVRRRGWAQSVAERSRRRVGLRAGPRPERRRDRGGVGVRAGGADRPPPGRPVGRRSRRRRRRAHAASAPVVTRLAAGLYAHPSAQTEGPRATTSGPRA